MEQEVETITLTNMNNLPEHIQFEVVEDEVLTIYRPTVQLYEPS